MEREHIDNLNSIRDTLVEDRRNMVKSFLADPHGIGELAGDFLGVQQLIDTVERAISHEQSLDAARGRQGPGGFTTTPQMPRSGPTGQH